MKHKLLAVLLALITALCLCIGVACGESGGISSDIGANGGDSANSSDGGNGGEGNNESNTIDPLIGLWTGKMQNMDVELSIAEWDGDLYFFMISKIGGISQDGSGGSVEKTDTGCTLILYPDEDDGTASCTLSDDALTVNIPAEGSDTVPIVFALSEKKELPPAISISGKRYYDEREYPYLDEVNNAEEDMEPYTNTSRYIEIDFSTGAVSYYKVSGRQTHGESPWYHCPGSIVSYTGKVVKVGNGILILSSADAQQSVIVYQENDTLQMICSDFARSGPDELTSTPNRERVKLTIRYQGNFTGKEVYMVVKGKKVSELRIDLVTFYEFDETDKEIVLNEDTEITLNPIHNS